MIDFDSAYVSGGMRNKPFFNFPAFDAARDYLIANGVNTVHSPADNDRHVWPQIEQSPGFAEGSHEDLFVPGYSFPELFVWDVWAIGDAEAIVLLPGWETSEGALLELQIARAFGRKIRYAVFGTSTLGMRATVVGVLDYDPKVGRCVTS